MEDSLDVPFKLEVVVLAKVNLAVLQIDRLFNDFLQILLHFFHASPLYCLLDGALREFYI